MTHRRMEGRREEERDAGLLAGNVRRPPGGAAMLTPSASKRSALPHRLDTDRLPCFATLTPHAATTSAATVETLNVCARSPPVPQVSKTSENSRDSFVAASAHGTRQPDDLRRTLTLHRQRR